MEKHGPPKISKSCSTLTLNKKGNRYYSHVKEESQNVLGTHLSSETTDFPHLTHPLDHVEITTDNFASQSEDSEKSSAENKQYFAPSTTKYKKALKPPQPAPRRKGTKSVVTETTCKTFSCKNHQTNCGDIHDFKIPLCDSDFLHKLSS